jgi:hypothetical protein
VLLAGVPLPPDAGAIPGAFRAAVLTDHDPATASTAPVPLLRMFDALPVAARFDVGIVMDPSMPVATFTPIFGNVGFGEQGRAAPGVASAFDALDYFQAAASTNVTVGARVAGTTGPLVLSVGGLAIQANTFTTAVFTQAPNTGGMVHTAALLCVDNAPPHGGLSACQVVVP